DLSGAEVDVIAFDDAIARGDSASLGEAVELYRGPLLEGGTEEWVRPERDAREQAYLGALERLAAEAQAGGGWAPARSIPRGGGSAAGDAPAGAEADARRSREVCGRDACLPGPAPASSPRAERAARPRDDRALRGGASGRAAAGEWGDRSEGARE